MRTKLKFFHKNKYIFLKQEQPQADDSGEGEKSGREDKNHFGLCNPIDFKCIKN